MSSMRTDAISLGEASTGRQMPGAELDDAPGVEVLVASEREQEKGFAVGESSERRAQPAVGDDRCATWEQLIVIGVRTRLDFARGADRLGAHCRSQGQDRVHCLTVECVTDALDEGLLALHHGGAEAEEDERSPLGGASFLGRPGHAKRPGVYDVGRIVGGEIEPRRDGHEEHLG
jgi:hypothetical protein